MVKMSIEPSIKLPVDSVATIASTGLLGDKYLAIVPGAEDEYIKPGGRIEHTTPPVSLESMIGQFIYGMQGSQQSKPNGQAPAAK